MSNKPIPIYEQDLRIKYLEKISEFCSQSDRKECLDRKLLIRLSTLKENFGIEYMSPEGLETLKDILLRKGTIKDPEFLYIENGIIKIGIHAIASPRLRDIMNNNHKKEIEKLRIENLEIRRNLERIIKDLKITLSEERSTREKESSKSIRIVNYLNDQVENIAEEVIEENT